MTTVTDADIRQLRWGNGGTGQVISVERIFTSGDIIYIDCENEEVTLNGVAINYDGAFPSFEPGDQIIQYFNNFTGGTRSVSFEYTKRYM
jgi:phage-related protein